MTIMRAINFQRDWPWYRLTWSNDLDAHQACLDVTINYFSQIEIFFPPSFP